MMVSSLLWVVEFIIIIIIIRERIKAHEGQNWTTIFVFFSKDFFFSTYKKKKKNGDQFKRKFERPRFRSHHRYKGTRKRTVKRARCRTGARTGPPLALAPPRVVKGFGCVARCWVFVKAPQSHHHESSSAFVGSASARRRPFELEFSQRVGRMKIDDFASSLRRRRRRPLFSSSQNDHHNDGAHFRGGFALKRLFRARRSEGPRSFPLLLLLLLPREKK